MLRKGLGTRVDLLVAWEISHRKGNLFMPTLLYLILHIFLIGYRKFISMKN